MRRTTTESASTGRRLAAAFGAAGFLTVWLWTIRRVRRRAQEALIESRGP